MRVETKIKLSKFVPRPYQVDVVRAIEEQGYKRALLCWSRRCLSGDTHVTMADGSWKPLRDVVVGDRVLSWDGEKFCPDIVVNHWNAGVKETLTVKSEHHLDLVSSKDHLFLCLETTTKLIWKKLCDIGARDTLCCDFDTLKTRHLELTLVDISPSEPEELYDIETKRNHNFVANGYVVHNSGKDHTALFIALRQMLKRVCTVFYIFPTAKQARLAIWDGINSDGRRIIEYIPPELIANKNDTEMKIRLENGSVLQFIGSTDVDRVRGTACYVAIFSEFATQDPNAWAVLRPALAQNDGIALFCSTPFGKNHFYDLYQLATASEKWYSSTLTASDTGHIPAEVLEDERREMSEDLFQQEYYVSFEAGVEGAYYAKYLNKMRLNNQIGDVPYEVGFPVHTAWDLGVSDSTVIIFFQNIGQSIRIIDYYENNSQGLEHYANVLRTKDYVYGKHIAPHDIAVRELGSGMSRLEKARSLGINFITAPNLPVIDGIEAVRSTLGKMWIDATRCGRLIKVIDTYRKEWDDKRKVYRDKPLHDQYSDGADALRMLCVSLPKTCDGLTPEDLDRRFQEAMYGDDANLPPLFRDDHKRYY